MMYVQLATFYHHSYLLNREMYAGAQPLARTPLYVVLVVFCSDQDQPPRSIYGEYEYKIPLYVYVTDRWLEILLYIHYNIITSYILLHTTTYIVTN